jgi:hypothetical protein
MTMSKTLGPWPRGLNLTSNRDLSLFLGADELGSAHNVVFTPEGFVQPRPGCRLYDYDFGAYDTIEVIGNISLPNGTTVVIVQTKVGNQFKLWKILDKTTVEALPYTPSVNVRVTHILSYKSSVGNNHSGIFFFTNSAGTTFKNVNLDLSGGAAAYQVVQGLNAYNVPASHKGFIVKDRLFLFDYDNSTMWWSPANYILDFNKVHAEGAAGTGTDVYAQEPIDVTIKEDGFRAVEFYNNNFYIFKKSKTYLFTYQSLPSEDGYLRKISDDMGAFDSTLFRGNVVVVNRKGVYKLDGSEFIDLQRKMNFRFELPIDHPNVSRDDIFITDFNEDIVFGFRDAVNSKAYHYCMNGNNGAWADWSFDYAAEIASPGSHFYRAQGVNTTQMVQLFNTFNKKHITYMDYKPGPNLPTFHMDGDLKTPRNQTYYIPPVSIKTAAMFADSPLRYFKIYRTFIRFYMSDIPQSAIDILKIPTALWTLSLNYNDYKFEYDTRLDGNPIFSLYPSKLDFFEKNLLEGSNVSPKTAVYVRTYQIPLPQQRAKEMVVELKRVHTAIPAAQALELLNPDTDRPIKNGYYFMLSSIWIDYQNKAGI